MNGPQCRGKSNRGSSADAGRAGSAEKSVDSVALLSSFINVIGRVVKTFSVAIMITWLCGHWAILQCVAWAGMALSNAHSLPLKNALAKTFAGKNPCHICEFVREGRSTEKKKEIAQPNLKLEFYHFTDSVWLDAVALFPAPQSLAAISLIAREAPPTPPPDLLPV